jgi:hypothetical protein
MMVTQSAGGEYTYAITCSGAPPAASAQVKVEFTSASTAGGTKSGGGGGIGPLSLLFLGLLAVRRVFASKSRRTIGQQQRCATIDLGIAKAIRRASVAIAVD